MKIEYSEQKILEYLIDHPDYVVHIRGSKHSVALCKKPIELLQRVAKVLREDVGFTKEKARIIQEEFYEDIGEPYETLNLIEDYLKENENGSNSKNSIEY